ncbi:MAG: response regulator [Bacillota bacterium]|nr:response regulator [Bacillota bacterium]
MNIIAVDDERLALLAVERAVKNAVPEAELTTFLSVEEALEYAENHMVDVAFLDIEMAGMNGLQLAGKLKDICGRTNIIFVSGHKDYAINAFAMHASGYVLKPIDEDRVRDELDNLYRAAGSEVRQGVYVQCFGNFEVFVDGKPVHFYRPKAKEALAYLVDRKGANISKKELAAILWEDRPYTRSIQSHLYKLIAHIGESLRNAGAEDILLTERGCYSVDTAKFSCDYYDYNRGDSVAVNSYQGEYMSQYSWSEFSVGAFGKWGGCEPPVRLDMKKACSRYVVSMSCLLYTSYRCLYFCNLARSRGKYIGVFYDEKKEIEKDIQPVDDRDAALRGHYLPPESGGRYYL